MKKIFTLLLLLLFSFNTATAKSSPCDGVISNDGALQNDSFSQNNGAGQKSCFIEISSKSTINVNQIISFEKIDNDTIDVRYGNRDSRVHVGNNKNSQDEYIKKIIFLMKNCK
jgi:hypothetical protein